MSLDVVIGPMFSGKSSYVLSVISRYSALGVPVLVITHESDVRYGQGLVATHDGRNAPCVHAKDLDDVDIAPYTVVIVDEAQSLERGVLLTVLSRIGTASRVVLTHDIAQRDNLRVGRHDGVVAVVETLKGHPLFAHVTLTRSERSPIAALVTEMLEGSPTN